MFNKVKMAVMKLTGPVRNKKGMELVQVAILSGYLDGLRIEKSSKR